jgi:uncharacterized protein YciI
MFILELGYTAPVERVDALLEEHVVWLDKHYEAGRFIASGRKDPRDGGVIISVGGSRAEVEELVGTDPFVVGQVAEYRVVEFIATKTAPALAQYREELPPAT